MPPADLMAAVRDLRDYPEPYRIMSENFEVFPTSYGSLVQAQHMLGETPMRLQRVDSLLEHPNGWRAWQLFNVRFMVTTQEEQENPELVNQVGDTNIYHVRYTLPRIWAVSDVQVVNEEAENLAATMDENLSPGLTAVLEEEPALPLTPGQDLRLDLRNLSYKSWWLTADVETAANAVLVFSEVYYPGWRAYLDGQEVPILRANHAFRAIELPAGSHHLEMQYVPITFWGGLMMSTLTLALIAVAFLRVGPRVLRNKAANDGNIASSRSFESRE